MKLITVHTDQGPCEVPANTTVAALLSTLRGAQRELDASVATAVNGEFVPRSEREHHVLFDGDTLLCFGAITGG